MTEKEELIYEQGKQMMARHMFSALMRELPTPEIDEVRWRIERMEVVAALRQICEDFGDNDWEDNLTLSDVIDKHLATHLHLTVGAEWQPITTAPKDGTEIIVGVDVASVWITRGAWWRNAEDNPNEFEDADTGWWSYANSVTQEKLEGIYEPTHWLPMPPVSNE